MKILFLARSLGFGGAERQMTVLARSLAERGHEVAVALFYTEGPFVADLRAAGVPVIGLEKRGRWDLAGPVLRLIGELRRRRPEVLHGYLPTADILATLVRPFSPRTRLVFGIRASDMDLARYGRVERLTYAVEAWLSRFADLIISNSKAGLEAAWSRGFPPGRGVVIRNGVDTDRFRPDEGAWESRRARLGVGRETALIGIVGRRDPMKDHPTFLAAARDLAASGLDAAFVMMGKGVDAVPGRETVGRPVIALPPDPDPASLIAALDVAVLSSAFGEGFPNVVAEAMACGVACAVTDVGDAGFAVGDLGLVVPPGDPAALAEAVRRLVPIARDPALRRARRERVLSLFSVSELTRRTEAALAALSRPVLVHLVANGAEVDLSEPGFRHIVVGTLTPAAADAARTEGVEVIGIARAGGLIRRLRPVEVRASGRDLGAVERLSARLVGARVRRGA